MHSISGMGLFDSGWDFMKGGADLGKSFAKDFAGYFDVRNWQK